MQKAEVCLEKAKSSSLMFVTAESCTGGLLSGLFTEFAGSSSVLERGFVTYSNAAKTELLGVPADLISEKGAVSAEVASAMAVGALAHSHADLSLSVTGIAGPGGARPGKPMGLVYIGLGMRAAMPQVEKHIFEGGRAKVREAALFAALKLIEKGLNE